MFDEHLGLNGVAHQFDPIEMEVFGQGFTRH
jgi:hypothetical protein